MLAVIVQLDDSRRLTGPNLLADRAGAVIDGTVRGVPIDDFVVAWRARVREVLDAVGWGAEWVAHRAYEGGVTVFHSAPIDALYAATEVNEWAWRAAAADVGARVDSGQAAQTTVDGEEHPPGPGETLTDASLRLSSLIEAEQNPALLLLAAAAADRGVTFLSDDDLVSVGSGTGSRTWPVSDLPSPAGVPWRDIHDVPRVVVTGTNGKTTTVRMLAAIGEAADRTVGFTCTDGIYVDGEVVEAGDWSGPGGGRAVLRDTRVDFAILETARGGMLRRGLAVDRADAALVTNVAADHLGEWGVLTVDDVAEAKLVVAKSVRHGAPLIVNADDPHLARAARRLERPLTWIADEQADSVALGLAAPEVAWIIEGGWLVKRDAQTVERVVSARAIPATFDGAASYNVSNALAAAALADALGLPLAAIRTGLEAFDPTPDRSPGRGNLFDLGGVKVLVDFVHNPHGLAAMAQMVDRLSPSRVAVMIGHAGDRDDEAIRELARATWRLGPERVAVKELRAYLRGREPGEVPEIIRAELMREGAVESAISLHGDEVAASRALLEWSRPGDFLLLSTQSDRAEVLALVAEVLAAGWGPGSELPDCS